MVLFVIILVMLVGLGAWLGRRFPDAAALNTFLGDLAGVSPLLYVGIYFVLTLLFVPLPLMVMSAGLIFGWFGMPVLLVGTVMGALVAHVLCRTLLRQMVNTFVAKSPRLLALDKALHRDGVRLTLLLRLSPAMPYGMFNYLSGLAPMSVGAYAGATVLGLLPRVVLGISLGAAGKAALQGGAGGSTEATVTTVFVVITTLLATFWIGRIATAALKKEGLAGEMGGG